MSRSWIAWSSGAGARWSESRDTVCFGGAAVSKEAPQAGRTSAPPALEGFGRAADGATSPLDLPATPQRRAGVVLPARAGDVLFPPAAGCFDPEVGAMGMEGWDAAGGEAEAVVSGRFDRLEARCCC